MESNPIVITGAGVVSAIGVGKEATLSALKTLHTGIGEVKYLQTTHHELPVGEVKLSNDEMQQMVSVDADNHENLSRTVLMARLALQEALSEAGLVDQATGKLYPEVNGQIPLISGTCVAGMDLGENIITSTDHEAMMQEMLNAATDCGTNTEKIARGFGDFALLDTMSTACSSAANAIALGANMLKTGRFQRAIVGGTESLSRFHMNGFNTLMILDHVQCRPLDASRAGLNLGEGAAYLVIETLSSAKARNVQPIAILSGYGNACDAFHQTASSEDGEGAYRAMKQAIEMSGLAPSDIDYVNAHGTGTPNNDPSELTAMHRIFDQAEAKVLPAYSSTKGFTGHTTAASGSIEAVFCLLALQHQFLPVSLGCMTPIEGEPAPVGPDDMFSKEKISHILCNAFGFGGNDSSMIFSHISTLSSLEKDDVSVQTGKRIYVIAENKLAEGDADPDFKKYMTVGEARRLGPMLKRTLAISLQTLLDAGQENADGNFSPYIPDAIITGTAWGNTDSSETFLRDMLTGGEQLLKPTPFMQSTHNTIGSLIAINTKNHGYNNTHSQGQHSLDMALLDAVMLMQLGQIKSALVGLHDTIPSRLNHAILIVSEDGITPEMQIIRELNM